MPGRLAVISGVIGGCAAWLTGARENVLAAIMHAMDIHFKRRYGFKRHYGFSLESHRQTSCPQPGQPRPYFSKTACSRSIPATLAIVASQARTSANSLASSSRFPSRSAAASSPTSSISHMNVPSIPRASSFDEYIVLISDCKSDNVIDRESRGAISGIMILLLEFVSRLDPRLPIRVDCAVSSRG